MVLCVFSCLLYILTAEVLLYLRYSVLITQRWQIVTLKS